MNSKDYRHLQEAYIGVYDNDIREKLEFESWVNNLLEEGYDLSDYTWDELYENYTQLDEISIGMKRRAADASVDKVKKAGERFRSSTSVDVQPYLMKKKDKAEAQHLRLAKAAESYDQQLDEISQKTATRAFATRATNEFETDSDNPRDFTKSGKSKADQTRSRIEKKYGKAAGNSADRAAHTGIFGRKSFSMPKESYDLYDIILSHLIDEGYADTEEAAERIMVNMSEGWRETIVETRMDPRGRPASGPMNVYANSKGKPSQARLDAIKSYEDEQRKKTPEQRKKELDDYRERQMNNK